MVVSQHHIQNTIYELHHQVKQLEIMLKTPPSLTLHGIQQVPTHVQNDWKKHVWCVLSTIGINTNWVLEVLNPCSHYEHSNYVEIQFISHSAKNKAYTIIEAYILQHISDIFIEK